MLTGIDPLLSPELLHMLASMGHGDELLIADANFPASSMARRLSRLDGTNTSTALTAILTLFPLDQYQKKPAAVMAVVDDPEAVPETEIEFRHILDSASGKNVSIERLERFAFYERAKLAFAIVATSEHRLYGNIIIAKGVIKPVADYVPL